MSTTALRRHRWSARVGTLAAVGTLLAGALTGCSMAPSDESGPHTLTAWAWGAPATGMKATAKLFEKAHPGYTVKVQDVGNPAIWDKITSGMAAGGFGLPDVMDIGGDYVSNYLETFPDSFADLSDMGADALAKDFPSGLWKGGQNARGEQYGIPFEVNTNLVYYRKDLFRKAGVDIGGIHTWDQMLDAGVKIKKATGADLFALDKAASQADAANLFEMLARLEGTFFFDKGGNISLTDRGSVSALDFLKRANDKGLVTDIPQSQGTTSQMKGQSPVAIMPGASWMVGSFPTTAPEMKGKWGVRMSPAMHPGGFTASSAGATYLTVAQSSEKQKLAYEYVRFSMATLSGQRALTRAAGLFPSYRPMWDAAEFKQSNPYFGIDTNRLVVKALGQKTPPDYYTRDFPRALKAFDDAQTQVLVKGADPKKALDSAAKLLSQQTGRKIGKD
ncbi:MULTISPECIES: sugar ABC transporter substrate-binding protein [unclassified Streptomyces]|uniref:ABC transporter substrate-binding protein n=1 Tax=unclassified Streptomyces TaxID=2593676 RepID=UPI000DBA409E|nr:MULTISPECIES: sugar ABC transporter substrate-binding protein [unclassified Streptomyces]MYT68105.1 extracellular solute-binding protein [Streptomyces sp. SID8367]RAJ72670.1 lactose/L-arabinose transport system substrate-binding protein [Streptomyces sp. PsTaAH-137]